MKCEKCGLENAKCIDSRERKKGTRYRRYECLSCGYRWTTIELKIKEKHLKEIIEDDGHIEAAIIKTMEITDELKFILKAVRKPRSGELPPEDGQQES